MLEKSWETEGGESMNVDLNRLFEEIVDRGESYDVISCVQKFYGEAVKVGADHGDWQMLETDRWCQVLAYAPVDDEVEQNFDFGRLDGSDWAFLLIENEDMIRHPAFSPEKLSALEWLEVAFFYPGYLSYCPEDMLLEAVKNKTITPKMFGREIEWAPEYTIRACEYLEHFGNWLLDHKVMLSDKDLKKLAHPYHDVKCRNYDWSVLVSRRPEFLKHPHCPWREFTESDWERIRVIPPEVLEKYIEPDLFGIEVIKKLNENKR